MHYIAQNSMRGEVNLAVVLTSDDLIAELQLRPVRGIDEVGKPPR